MTTYSSIPYFLYSDLFQTNDHPPNLEEYLNVHFHYTREKERFTIKSRSLDADGTLHVWNTGLLTEDGTDDYYAFHLEFDDFKPILSLIPSKEACLIVNTGNTNGNNDCHNNQDQLYHLYLTKAISKFYDQDLYILQWPHISSSMERCSFFKNQKIESLILCDYIVWDLDSIKCVDLPKSLHPYKDDIVMNQLRISIEETRRIARINPRLAIPGLSRRDLKEDLSLQNINNMPVRNSWEASNIKNLSPLTRDRQKEKIPPVGLLLPLQIHDIDAKDCDSFLLYYDCDRRKYIVREILSLAEAQNRVRFIQPVNVLEDSWLYFHTPTSNSVKMAQHEITRQRSQSQHSPSTQFSHHGTTSQTINGLGTSSSLHNLSLYASHDNTEQQFPIQVSTNHFTTTPSVHSWDAVSVSTSPIISPRNNAGANIWSPSSPTESPSSQINHHLSMYKQNNGRGNRPRSFSSPLLFPGTHTPFTTLPNGFQLPTSLGQYTDMMDSGISHISQSDIEGSSLYNSNSQHQAQSTLQVQPLQTSPPQNQHPSPLQATLQSSMQTSLSSSLQQSSSSQIQNIPQNQAPNQSQSTGAQNQHQSSQLSQISYSQSQKATTNSQEEKPARKYTEAQLDAKKSASLIPETDPIWKYKQWQLLEMYEKIKKDYPTSPDLGTDSLREEIIYHMLRANFKWKCELCLRFNQQDPIKSGCKFKKAPWKCYFAHGTDDLRQKKRYF